MLCDKMRVTRDASLREREDCVSGTPLPHASGNGVFSYQLRLETSTILAEIRSVEHHY